MSKIIASQTVPSETVGLMIRGSDKCQKESMCLSFDRYMEFVTDVAYPALPELNSSNAIANTSRPRLIMTTEDPKVFNHSYAYQSNASFPFQFMVNDKDNLQGSGLPRHFRADGENTVVSSLMTLKMHLNAGKVYLNSCSNWHLVLARLVTSQCGVKRHRHEFIYSNQNDDPTFFPVRVAKSFVDEDIPRKYRICCSWSSEPSCVGIWEDYKKERENLK